MKNIRSATLIITCVFLCSFNKGGYKAAMKNTLKELNKANGQGQLQTVANKFERIGTAEKDKWLPYYYVAYSYTMMTTTVKEVSLWDGYLDAADAAISKAEKLDGDLAEILALKGFANMMRINVDPAVRGQTYSMKSAGFLQQALLVDEQNPRVLLLLGQLQFGTAQFFGAGTEEACTMFATAKEFFDEEADSDRGLLPSWGLMQAISMIKHCEG